jgi:hypothetical protein
MDLDLWLHPFPDGWFEGKSTEHPANVPIVSYYDIN